MRTPTFVAFTKEDNSARGPGDSSSNQGFADENEVARHFRVAEKLRLFLVVVPRGGASRPSDSGWSGRTSALNAIHPSRVESC